MNPKRREREKESKNVILYSSQSHTDVSHTNRPWQPPVPTAHCSPTSCLIEMCKHWQNSFTAMERCVSFHITQIVTTHTHIISWFADGLGNGHVLVSIETLFAILTYLHSRPACVRRYEFPSSCLRCILNTPRNYSTWPTDGTTVTLWIWFKDKELRVYLYYIVL